MATLLVLNDLDHFDDDLLIAIVAAVVFYNLLDFGRHHVQLAVLSFYDLALGRWLLHNNNATTTDLALGRWLLHNNNATTTTTTTACYYTCQSLREGRRDTYRREDLGRDEYDLLGELHQDTER